MKTLAFALLLVLLPLSAQAGDFEAHGQFSTHAFFRSDADFSRAQPVYDGHGQAIGQAATRFMPDFSWRPVKNLELFYQVDMGWNAWSRNNPDQGVAGSNDYFLVKHRELWAAWKFENSTTLKTGYQYVQDPSGVYMAHWVGAVNVTRRGPSSTASFTLGQLPDDSFEGIGEGRGYPSADRYFLNAMLSREGWRGLTFDLFLGGLVDSSRVGHSLQLATLVAGVSRDFGKGRAFAHILGQIGRWDGAALSGDTKVLTGLAGQARYSWRRGPLFASGGALLIAPDDDDEGNPFQSSFFYSGKNRSPTLILTEDEFRDRYDNLDERISQRLGSFYLTRAGLVLADATFGMDLNSRLSGIIIAGGAWTLNAENSGGGNLVGIEANLMLDFALAEGVSLLGILQGLVPGQAAAVFVNATDPYATTPVGGAQAAFLARF